MVPVKKLIALFLMAAVICTSVVGCGGDTSKPATKASTPATPAKTP
jgi:hypothetical protein